MPRPRKAQVSLDATPYYHCVSRCVRRAFLCGTDKITGKDFGHRRQWIEEKLLQLQAIFAIDICAYAIMANHYHVVLYINAEHATAWTEQEVIERWHRLFNGTHLTQRYLQGEALGPAERLAVGDIANQWRARLIDISWFMRVMNETIARQANKEDDCTGRFWEGRYKSQALLDEKALMACMAYVDLNPIRAKLTETPETSDYTAIQQRAKRAQQAHSPNHPTQQPTHLMTFSGYPGTNRTEGLPFRLTDYLDLVDWTGRVIREDKRGHIPEALPPILTRLSIDPEHWLYMSQHFESRFKGLVGSIYRLKQACRQLGYQRTTGFTACRQLL